MTRPMFVPHNAPFNPDQRRWLDGYLAGLATAKMAADSAAEAVPQREALPVMVLYGSQSGNSEALSRSLRKKGRGLGLSPQVAALNTFDRERLPEVRHLLIVTSTFGEGAPPDNARQFCDWIHSDEAPPLPGLSYSVCALGDRNYTHFCKTGIDLDERLAELGATRLAPRAECDVDVDEPFAAWMDSVFSNPELAEAAGDAPAATEADEDKPEPAWTKKNPFQATFLGSQILNREGSAKQVAHVELALPEPGPTYKAGDALGVLPVNCPELVEEALSLAGCTGTETVTVSGRQMPMRVALLRHRELTAFFDEPHAAAPQALVDELRPLQPRLYSIASSPSANPNTVHLTVGVVRYESGGRRKKGVASTFLAERLSPGASVGVYVHSSSTFGLPEDDSTPVIMVGPGTGIAPFRAFLEERQSRQASGKNWLFFGDQHAATDFLYRDQLTRMTESGLLNRLDTAFSRDQDEKVYVQHRMIERGADIWRWLEDGAHFYVCGDASRMAADVDAALHEIVATHGAMTPEAAGEYVKKLAVGNRYQRDVY